VGRVTLAQLSDVTHALREGTIANGARLRISTECYTCYHWLPALIRQYRRRFPQVQLRINAEATRRPLASLLDGELDLAIMSSRVADPRVVVVPLFEDEIVVVVSPNHPFARRPYVRAEDFATETLIIYGPREESSVLTNVILAAGVHPADIQQVQLTEAIVEMAKAELGVGVLARWAVQPHVDAGQVRTVRLTETGYTRHWRAVVARPAADAVHVQEFIRLVALSHRRAAGSVLAFPRRRAPRLKSQTP
jgi:LysR family transcriptional regulator for metE and metH